VLCVAGGDGTAGGFGFLRLRDLSRIAFRAKRGICCARQRQRARFLATLGMTSSKRSQIIFVSEIALVLEIALAPEIALVPGIALVLEIGWDDQVF
jgi:hypothetical protein